MADPSMLTAHTRGLARSVFFRHRRVVTAPMRTPRSPVTQVIAPKIILTRVETAVRLLISEVSVNSTIILAYITLFTRLYQATKDDTSSLSQGFMLHSVLTSKSGLFVKSFNLSLVCAVADMFLCTVHGCLLNVLGSGQVRRDPHTKSTCGEGHGRRGERREHVASTVDRQSKHILIFCVVEICKISLSKNNQAPMISNDHLFMFHFESI